MESAGGGAPPITPVQVSANTLIPALLPSREKGAIRRPLKEVVGPDHGAPHVRGRRTVEAQALLGLLEVAPNDVGEQLRIDRLPLVEEVEVVERDQARTHVP